MLPDSKSVRVSSFGQGEHSQRWLLGFVGDKLGTFWQTAADCCLLSDRSGAWVVRGDEVRLRQQRQVQRAHATTLHAGDHSAPSVASS
jgi:hypothetical protein